MRKNKEIIIKQDHKSLQLASLIHAPVFATMGYKNKEEDSQIIQYDLNRTKNERIVYKGLKLDVANDFPLFAIFISKYQQSKNFTIKLTEKELFDALEISTKRRDKAKKDVLEARLDRLRFCNVDLYYYESNRENDLDWVDKKSFPLFALMRWNREMKTIEVKLSSEIGNISTNSFSKELIDLTKLRRLRTQYAKSIYLYLQTRKFKNQGNAVYHNIDQMLERFGKSHMVKKEKKRKLKLAMEHLKTVGFIKNYEFIKSKYNIEKCKVYN